MKPLQGYVRNDATGEYATADKMTEVSGMMATYGNIKPNRRTFALQVEGFLNAQELEVRSFYTELAQLEFQQCSFQTYGSGQ